MRGLLLGSGSDAMAHPATVRRVLELASTPTPRVLYVGTGTYDLPGPQQRQTGEFARRGCSVEALRCATTAPNVEAMQAAVQRADVLVVSGGNTLYAVDRWAAVGLAPLLRSAAAGGTLLTGGSAGAICWFDAGHSDSADPETYRGAMLAAGGGGGRDESSAPRGDGRPAHWRYVRSPGLGLLPGIVCPHHDRVQSNGILRAADFDEMLLRHPGEDGVAIDHWAGLVIDGGRYEVFTVPDKEGSVDGRPGVWLKRVVDGRVASRPATAAGALSELGSAAREVVADGAIAACRAANPPPSGL